MRHRTIGRRLQTAACFRLSVSRVSDRAPATIWVPSRARNPTIHSTISKAKPFWRRLMAATTAGPRQHPAIAAGWDSKRDADPNQQRQPWFVPVRNPNSGGSPIGDPDPVNPANQLGFLRRRRRSKRVPMVIGRHRNTKRAPETARPASIGMPARSEPGTRERVTPIRVSAAPIMAGCIASSPGLSSQ